MLEMLMGNPYAWLLLSLCTIASLVFGIYSLIVGKKTKQISIDKYTNEIVKMGMSLTRKLEMKFDGKVIQDLSSTIFIIWNSGNDVINANDMVGEIPIKITCENEQFLDVKIIKRSDRSNDFRILNFNSKDIRMTFDYINSGEGLRLQILHTGSEEKIHVELKIKGGKAIRDCAELRKKSRDKSSIIFIVNELIIPMIALGLGYYTTILLFDLFEFASGVLSVIACSFFFGLILLFIYTELKSRVSKIFHKEVPEALKSGK